VLGDRGFRIRGGAWGAVGGWGCGCGLRVAVRVAGADCGCGWGCGLRVRVRGAVGAAGCGCGLRVRAAVLGLGLGSAEGRARWSSRTTLGNAAPCGASEQPRLPGEEAIGRSTGARGEVSPIADRRRRRSLNRRTGPLGFPAEVTNRRFTWTAMSSRRSPASHYRTRHTALGPCCRGLFTPALARRSTSGATPAHDELLVKGPPSSSLSLTTLDRGPPPTRDAVGFLYLRARTKAHGRWNRVRAR
jgi:hypothetical protein